MQEANRSLAERIAIVRAEHNAMSDRFDGETKRADEALAALRDAELEIEELRAQLDEAVDSVDDASAHTQQRPGNADSMLVEVPAHLVDKLQSVGGVAGLFSQLSERTQLIAEIDDENRRLKEETMLLEARCVTTETRLHHHVEEGAATSILLERGIGRMKAKSVGDADGAETRKTLTQAAMTLRRALEREGYDTTALPLAPDPGLDLPYLRQILSDHADMCSSHFTRGATGSIVPSATRKPLVYSSGRN
jgi:chromosome segregation ATPase